MTVELVYQYRQLQGRCDTGTGLDFDEIDTLSDVESQLPVQPPIGPKTWNMLRDRHPVTAVVRGRRLDDEVTLTNFGPHGCVCRYAPYAEEGSTVELLIEDADNSLSYRFKAQVQWLQDDGDDFAFGVEFVGVPLQVRYNSRDGLSEVEPLPASAEAAIAAA